MRRRMRVAFASIFALVMISCNTKSYYEFSENFYYLPYVIMSDTTYVKGDSVAFNMDSVLVEFFIEEETAFIKAYGGSGEYYGDAWEQIFDQVEADYDRNLAKVIEYDFEELIGGYSKDFNGKVEVVYEVRSASTQTWAYRDTLATMQFTK